jgi:flagellar biosynthesis/type III secretory pathway protein FliH
VLAPARGSSLSRLLQAPVVVSSARALHAPDPVFDPVVRTALAEAYARGRAEGETAGRAAGYAEAEADLMRAMGAVRSAFEATVATCQDLRRHESAEVVALAAGIAQTVVGREPSRDAVELLAQVRDALEVLDDPTLVVSANPRDIAVLERGLSDFVGLAVHADASLAPGEARVVGRWANASLTRDAAWEAVAAVLGEAPQ